MTGPVLTSVTSVTNLMKSVVTIDSRMGRPVNRA